MCPETSTKNADQEFHLLLTHLAANDLVISVEPDLLVLVQQGKVDHVELKGDCGREDAMKEIYFNAKRPQERMFEFFFCLTVYFGEPFTDIEK